MIDLLTLGVAGAGGLALYELLLRALDSHRTRTEQRQRADDRAMAQLALRRAVFAPLYGDRRLSWRYMSETTRPPYEGDGADEDPNGRPAA